MKTNRKLILGLLIVGLILSSMIRILFSVYDGFEYHDLWIKILPFPIVDLASSSPNELYLTSTIVGYFVFLLAGIFMIKDQKINSPWISLFISLVSISILFETISIIQDLNLKFNGSHFRIGPILFLLGLYLYYKDKIKFGKDS